MKALILGASGQVGGLLMRECRASGWECVGTAFKHPSDNIRSLDIRDAKLVSECVAAVNPDVVFVPGALTFVDYCETHPDECYGINVEGTANVARAIAGRKTSLVFFSTEHVFSDSPNDYSEDAPTAPMSVYAKSKVMAEERLREIIPSQHLILRTSWVYGPETQRKNFVYRAVATLRKGERLKVPADQYGQPTFSVDLAATAKQLLEMGISGTFHCVGPTFITRLDYSRLIARIFKLDASLIDGISTAELQQPAPRPLHIRLARNKLNKLLGRDPIRSPETALPLIDA
jgi:dTDP-4-dehydrorhamnose reductase